MASRHVECPVAISEDSYQTPCYEHFTLSGLRKTFIKSIYFYFKSLKDPGNGGFIFFFSLHKMKWLGEFHVRHYVEYPIANVYNQHNRPVIFIPSTIISFFPLVSNKSGNSVYIVL